MHRQGMGVDRLGSARCTPSLIHMSALMNVITSLREIHHKQGNQMPRTPSMHLALALGYHSMMRSAFAEHCSMDAGESSPRQPWSVSAIGRPGDHKPGDGFMTAVFEAPIVSIGLQSAHGLPPPWPAEH